MGILKADRNHGRKLRAKGTAILAGMILFAELLTAAAWAAETNEPSCDHEVTHEEQRTEEATCTSGAVERYSTICDGCGETLYTETVPVPDSMPLGHKPLAPVKENEQAATCTGDGGCDSVVYCETCEEPLSREHGEAYGSRRAFRAA